MDIFNEFELDVAREVINIGLARAADSFSSIIKQKALFISLDLGIKSVDQIDHLVQKPDDHFYNLITEVKGEMEGICYLIFNDREADIIKELCLPQELNDPEKLRIMGEAIMLEVDNMIAAAVITEFANMLSLGIYGDVPRSNYMTREESEDFIKNETEKYNYVISFKAKLATERTLLEPEFIWLLDEKFAGEIKRLTEDEQLVEKISKYNVRL